MMMLLERLWRKLYVNETLLLFEYKPASSPMSNNISPAEIVPITTENVTDALSFQSPQYIECFRQFLAAGDKGYFAYLYGECVHRTWTKEGPQTVYLHSLIPFVLGKDMVFLHYGETAKKARGKNILPHVIAQIAKDFPGKTILASVDKSNVSCQRVGSKTSFQAKAQYHILSIVGIRFIKTTNLEAGTVL